MTESTQEDRKVYRVVVQLGASCLAPRGDERVEHVAHVIEAVTMPTALAKAALMLEGGAPYVIASCEEVLPWPLAPITDSMVMKALKESVHSSELVQESIDEWPGYSPTMLEDWPEIITKVAGGLGDSGLVPGLALTASANSEGYADGNFMVEVYDRGRQSYRSAYMSANEISVDDSAVGAKGLLAIARAIIAKVEGNGLM